MTARSAINKEIFIPHNERMLAAVQVKRRTKKKIPFLATGGQGDYMTFICLSVTNKKPTEISITKVKQFEGSSSFVRRSQWSLDQLRQVNGIDPNRDCPEFDLTFENAFDQWVAGSAGDKCMFVQVLHNTCQRYSAERKPEFVNCQSKLLGEDQSVNTVVFRCKIFLHRMRKTVMSDPGVLLHAGQTRYKKMVSSYSLDGRLVNLDSTILFQRQNSKAKTNSRDYWTAALWGNSILHSAADSVSSAVQKASQALNERGERLGRVEEKTGDMMNSAQQFADTAHKLAMKHKC
ncbi:syntaxin-binding protein 6 isoform X2 [Hemibagrus wyckioides]|uniref:syntaxin-binding protein 6 isoform X2 n=1 Tax=Hemibagrus wyckioides TaxID=337641 RepID=UPI00266D1D5C|nr:syntaxin-binding protein 6 isoform X2 [Hemibagrus wyckioides]